MSKKSLSAEIEWLQLDAYLECWEGGTVVKRFEYPVDGFRAVFTPTI